MLQDMTEDDKYTCPVCTRLLQKKQRLEQRRVEAEAAAEIEREAREAQAARKAKLVSHCSSDETGRTCGCDTVAALVLMTDALWTNNHACICGATTIEYTQMPD